MIALFREKPSISYSSTPLYTLILRNQFKLTSKAIFIFMAAYWRVRIAADDCDNTEILNELARVAISATDFYFSM